MRRIAWTIDTADRLAVGHKLRHGGKKLVVESITTAPSATRPARLALEVSSAAASWAAQPEVMHLDAGDLVEMAA